MALAPGVEKEQSLRQGGFTDEDIENWKAETAAGLRDAGFSIQEADEYFGAKNPDMSETKKYFKANIEAAKAAAKPESTPAPVPKESEAQEPVNPDAQAATSFVDALEAGWQISVAGLIDRQKLPDKVVDEHTPMAYRIASQVATLAGDFPAMVAGGIGGGAAGSALPVVGTTIGAGAGAFAIPAGMRELLVQQYEKGDIQSAGDFLERASAVFLETAKGGVVGGLTAGVGGVVSKVVAGTALPVAAKVAAPTLAEIATMTTVSAALEGELPSPESFIEGGIVVFGLHGATKGAAKLRNIYAKTGVKPELIAEEIQKNPVLKQEILSDSPEIPKALQAVIENTKTEQPKPMEVVRETKTSFGEKIEEKLSVELMAEKPLKEEPPKVLDAAEQKIADMIGSPEKKTEAQPFSEIYRQTIDQDHPLKAFAELAGGKDLPAEQSPYVLQRLSRGAFGKADRMIEHGPVKFGTNEATGSRPLAQIFKDIPDVAEFERYWVSKRVLEKEAQGVKTGFDVEAAKLVAKKHGKKYEKALNEVVQFRNDVFDYMADALGMPMETRKTIKEANKSYAPFYRLNEDGSGGGPKGSAVKNPIKKMTGSEKKIVSPVESIFRDVYSFTEIVEKQKVAKAVVRLAEINPEAAKVFGIEKVPATQRPIEASIKEVEAWMKEHGIEGDPVAFTIFRPAEKALGQNEIAYYENGKRQIAKVHPAMAEVMKNMDSGSTSLMIDFLRGFSGTLRAGVTAMPDFGVRNFIKDQTTAGVNVPGYKPFFDAARGLQEIVGKGEFYKEWLSNGGANSAYINIDSNYIKTNVFRTNTEVGWMQRSWNVVKTPLERLKMFNDLMEQSTRVGMHKRLREQGKSPAAAALGSREGTVDFARIGAKMKGVAATDAFWNVSLQGKERTVRAVKEDPVGYAIRSAAYVSVPSILLWWANKDDKRVEALADHEKDLNWIVPTDRWEDIDPEAAGDFPEHLLRNHNGKLQVNTGVVYKIPKPPEIGIYFGTAIERTLDAYVKEDPDAFKNFSTRFMDSIDTTYFPTVAQPVVEHLANHSFFSGGNVVPEHMKGAFPELQYTDYTTESAKQIGKLIGHVPYIGKTGLASPMVIENYVRGWSGTAGMYALRLSDQALIQSGAVIDPLKPASTLADIPVIKAFVTRNPSANSRHIQNFYDRFEDTQRYFTSVKLEVGRGNIESAEQLIALQESEGKLADMTEAKNAMTNIRHLIQNTYSNQDYTPDEKRQLIDGAYYQLIQMAIESNRTLDEVEKSLRAN